MNIFYLRAVSLISKYFKALVELSYSLGNYSDIAMEMVKRGITEVIISILENMKLDASTKKRGVDALEKSTAYIIIN